MLRIVWFTSIEYSLRNAPSMGTLRIFSRRSGCDRVFGEQHCQGTKALAAGTCRGTLKEDRGETRIDAPSVAQA